MSKRYYTFATVGLCLITQTASKEVLKKINRWSFHKKKSKWPSTVVLMDQNLV
jgi:hypothetical protein